MTPWNEKVVCITSSSVPGSLNILILMPGGEVSFVCQREGSRLHLLVELCSAESIFLVNADGVVQVVQLPSVPLNMV